MKPVVGLCDPDAPLQASAQVPRKYSRTLFGGLKRATAHFMHPPEKPPKTVLRRTEK